jgi:hypothetical protein
MAKLKPLGIFFLLLGFILLEINLLFRWYFPYMDYNGIEFVYLGALVCRILLYTLACVIYDNLWDKYCTPKPRPLKNGDKIKLTHLEPCRNGMGTRNPYIGMSGVVHDLTEHDFSLLTETSWLVFIDLKTCKYIHIK